nr:hypothetical protein [Pandoravirus massiliensis]
MAGIGDSNDNDGVDMIIRNIKDINIINIINNADDIDDSDNGDGMAGTMQTRATMSWTRLVFGVSVALVLALNAALVGAIVTSVVMRQQEGNLGRDRLVTMLYTGVWCSSALAVIAAIVETWRDRFWPAPECGTAQRPSDSVCETIDALDAAFGTHICNRTWHQEPHEGDAVPNGAASARACTWRVVTWQRTAPGIVRFVAAGDDDRAPFEAHGVARRLGAGGVLYIAWTQTYTSCLSTAEGVDAQMRCFFSGTFESVAHGRARDRIRGLWSWAAPSPEGSLSWNPVEHRGQALPAVAPLCADGLFFARDDDNDVEPDLATT